MQMMKTMSVEDYILAFLEVAKEEKAEIDTVRLQKIFFLLENEEHVFMGIESEPDIFGPFSRKLQDVVKELVNEGKVKVGTYDVSEPLTGIVMGQRKIYYVDYADTSSISIDNKVIDFFRKWVKKSIWGILGYIYWKYPEYFLSVEKWLDQ